MAILRNIASGRMIVPDHWSLIDLEKTGSTNDDLKQVAAQNTPEGLVIRTYRQTAGKGRQGRVWTGVDGNLFMSVLLRPDVTPVLAGQLSLCAAVAVVQAIVPYLNNPADIQIKWPNDVLIGGKKLCGILLESAMANNGRVESVVLGMGVNIVAAGDPEVGCALQAHCQQDAGKIDRDVIGGAILAQLSEIYDIWRDEGFAAVQPLWLRYGHKPGDRLRIRLPKEEFYGVFEGLDPEGGLIVLCEGTEERRRVTSADVFAAA